MMIIGWSHLRTIALLLIGTTGLAMQPVHAKKTEAENQRSELLSIYSYAYLCSEAYGYIETGGFENTNIDLKSRPELLFWTKLADGAATALKFSPYDMGFVSGSSIFTKKRILGHDKMMADMLIIAADCAKEKSKYQLPPKG